MVSSVNLMVSGDNVIAPTGNVIVSDDSDSVK